MSGSHLPLEKIIIEAFPVRSLGRSGKELRRLVEILSDSAPLVNVETWLDMVGVLQSDTSIDELAAKILFLDGSSWQDFVPAWMSAAIRTVNVGSQSDDLLSCTLGTLDPKFSERVPEVFLERTSSLTAEQRNAIAHFVIWATEQPLLKGKQSEAFAKRLLTTWPLLSSAH